MEILTCSKPGQFAYGNIDIPVLTPGNALLKIKNIGICGTDIHAFEGTQPYFTYPRILGHELGCEFVESYDAAGFEPGEAVTFIPYFNCGKCIACRKAKPNCCQFLQVSGVHIDGGMVEYLSVPSSSLIHGEGLASEELALIEPLSVSAHGVGRAQIQPGEFVMIIGAGPIGSGAMEFARIAGGQVIAVDVNDYRLQFCKDKLKVPFAINALAPDLEKQILELTNGDMPAVIIDATGNLKSINNAFRFMAHSARYILIGLQKEEISFSHPEFHKREATLMSSRNATRADFEYVINCIKNGSIDPLTYITHRLHFNNVKDEFEGLIRSGTIIKAMVSMD
jgi:2-desacetyl-2-hydroxyethyl bacteriochlorophyllide A dehydrogenase